MSVTSLPAAQAMQEGSPLRGIGFTLLGTAIFAGCNALSKWLLMEIPVGEMLFVRAVIGVAIMLMVIRPADWAAMRAAGKPWLHALRMACAGIETGCYFWALTGLQLAAVTTIYLAGPIYVTAMSALFLGEQVGWRRWAAVVVGFVGVVVAVRPEGAGLSPHALVALVGSLLYAVSLVATRRLRATPTPILVLLQVATLGVLSAGTARLGWVMPTPAVAAAMGVIGVFTMTAYFCVYRGLQLAPASVIAPFNYTSIVGAVALGWLVFGEIPGRSTILGAAIIIGAGLFIVLRERRRAGAGQAG